MSMKNVVADEYQLEAYHTAPDISETEGLLMGALGISGETGEVTDYIKKVIFHKHPLDYDKLTKELGDALWYIAYLASVIKVPLSTIMTLNINKLKARYPEDFDPNKSLNRKVGDI